MKYSWHKLVTEMREAMLEMTTIVGQDQVHTHQLVSDFRMRMRVSDQFHAWDHDYDLERAFNKMPVRCNYRNLAAYWAYKRAREQCMDEIYGYLIAMETIIRDYFSNPMNFAPGAYPAKSITFGDLETKASKMLPMTIRLIKQM